MLIKTTFGKYTGLLLAIILFLVIDIGVLAFNVIASHEIEQDASEINIAGELRMVSQQLAKSTLTLEDEVRDNLQTQTSLAQILEASDEFDEALATLEQSRRGFFADLLGDSEAREERSRLLKELAAEWRPLGGEVRKMLEKKDSLTVEDIQPVSNKSVARNLKLLQLSDDLTQQMEDISRGKTTDIRRIQLIAITLATLNFIFIIFKFIRQLDASDRRAETARRETQNILDTVHQGLFLLSADGHIGDQRSASLERLFGRPIPPQAHFLDDVLGPILGKDEIRETAASYISMLFDRKVKPGLLAKLNPLTEIEVSTPNDPRLKTKYLSFAFEQVKNGKEVGTLLASVIDVTQEVLLQRELSGAEARTKTEIELLLGVIDQEPPLVQKFIADARARIEQINNELQNVRPDAASYGRALNYVARNIHAIKGEAALLGIGAIENHVHALEGKLTGLRENKTLIGEDFIAVAVGVNELLDRIERVESVVSRVSRFAAEVPTTTAGTPTEVSDALAPAMDALKQLGARIANDLGKEVFFEVDFPPLKAVPEQLLQVCQEVLPQLIRNAVVHGIEDRVVRERHGKEPVGHILVRFDLEGASGYRVRVRDDGAGISLPALRRRAIDSGRYSELDVQQMGDHQIASMLFEPGFSTVAEAHLHAGRGDGMAVVREAVARLGARLRVLSTARSFTEFVIYKPA